MCIIIIEKKIDISDKLPPNIDKHLIFAFFGMFINGKITFYKVLWHQFFEGFFGLFGILELMPEMFATMIGPTKKILF